MGDEILTAEELGSYLKIPKYTVYKLARDGRIPAARVGKHWRFKKRKIDQWLHRQHDALTKKN